MPVVRRINEPIMSVTPGFKATATALPPPSRSGALKDSGRSRCPPCHRRAGKAAVGRLCSGRGACGRISGLLQEVGQAAVSSPRQVRTTLHRDCRDSPIS